MVKAISNQRNENRGRIWHQTDMAGSWRLKIVASMILKRHYAFGVALQEFKRQEGANDTTTVAGCGSEVEGRMSTYFMECFAAVGIVLGLTVFLGTLVMVYAPSRFSLRGLLITTTLVALVLGSIVCIHAARK